MVVQKRVSKEAGHTACRGTLQWGVEFIMGRGTLPWGVELIMGRGTLPWGTEESKLQSLPVGYRGCASDEVYAAFIYTRAGRELLKARVRSLLFPSLSSAS